MDLNKKLKGIDIPRYTFKQEVFNSFSHFMGIPIGLVAIVISIKLRVELQLQLPIFIAMLIYGASIVFLYFVSGIYHFSNPYYEKRKKVLRVLDHCTIYVLIAGTYTPISVYLFLEGHIIGLVLLILEWSLAALGAILNAIDFKNKLVQSISMFLYLALGWMLLYSGAFQYLAFYPFLFILLGGVSYTFGSILYGIGHKNLYFHSYFHIFVLIGTILQLVGILKIFF